MPLLSRRLQRVGERAQRLLVDIVDLSRDQRHAVDLHLLVRRRAGAAAAAERELGLELLHFLAQLRLAGADCASMASASSCGLAFSARTASSSRVEPLARVMCRRRVRSAASMRRTPAATPDSSVMKNSADVAGRTDVRAAAELDAEAPSVSTPHPGTVTTARGRRTSRRRAPSRPRRSLPACLRTSVCTGVLPTMCSLTMRSMRASSSGVTALKCDEVEAQAIRRDERAGLLDMRAEHLPQRRVEQVRRGVIAPRRVAEPVVHDGRRRDRRRADCRS